MKTIVVTEIEGDQFKSTTPHANGLIGVAPTESMSVNALAESIRSAIREGGKGGIEWNEKAKAPKSKDVIVRQLSGMWPPVIKQPQGQEPDTPEVPAESE